MERQIDEIANSQRNQNEKLAGYVEILRSIPYEEANLSTLDQFVTKMLSISYGRIVSVGPVIDQLLEEMNDKEIEQNVLIFTLRAIQPFIVSFGIQDMRIRNRLVELYEAEQDYRNAAVVLQDRLSGSERQQQMSDDEKFEIYVRIVRYYLEADQPENAAGFISKAQYLRPTLKNKNAVTDIHFKLSQARILDSTRKFLDAAMKYYDVSRESSIVDEDDRLQCLAQAVACTILGSAGPQRSQFLRKLYNDDRSRQLSQFRILEKVYLDRLLLAEDVDEFSAQLAPHQLVSLPDGTTVLTRSVIDHNVLSVSKIYSNILISQLAQILGLDPAKTETYTGNMISQSRLAARIDQVDGIIYFQNQQQTGTALLKNVDDQVQDMYSQLDDIVGDLQKKFPQLANSMVH
jgi:COP9 signalosome complex subunit 4